MILVEYASPAALFAAVAARVSQDLSAGVAANGRAALAVPGGSTPGPLFDLLQDADVDWGKTTVMLGDERWVPLDSPRSNTGLIKARLLQGKAAAATYQPLYNGAASAQAGAGDLAQQVAAHLPLTVAVLGMGADMHTASIFPGAPEREAAQADDAPAALAMTPGDGLEDRITLSARALASAAHIHVVILGDDKKAALAQAQTSDIAAAPIAQFLPKAMVHWAPKEG